MTQKEKANAYDEAIKRAKDALNDGTISNNTIAYLQDVFPQLKESEDEKIRKNLLAFLEDIWHLGKNANFDKWGKSNCSDWIIWLEKQDKKVDVIENFDTEFEKQVSHLLASVINKDYEYTEGFVKWVSSNLLGYAKYEIERQNYM